MSYSDPAHDAFAVTPSNSTMFVDTARALYIGTGGDVTLLTSSGNVVLFKSVPSGTVLPVRANRVNATGTTASDIVALE